MNTEREQFWEDFDSDEVHMRDRWQFALKSEFFPKAGIPHEQCIQEFYLFVPNSLQINRDTYSKTQFYHDLTSLIRYKTPEFSFTQLLDSHDLRSPLTCILNLCHQPNTAENSKNFSYELKLLANVIRSSLRREVKALTEMLQHSDYAAGRTHLDFSVRTRQLVFDVQRLREMFAGAQKQFIDQYEDVLLSREWRYIDEFISEAISHYLTGLLETIRLASQEDLKVLDKMLSALLVEEKRLHHSFFISASHAKAGHINTIQGENILYRISLLNKFVLDALLLSTNRLSMAQRFQHWIGALSAGVAMLLYFSLFAWLGSVFFLNSLPFILLTVVIYVLKDRIKEWMRAVSYQTASRWFPDYTTVIQSLDQKSNLGVIHESFSFIEQAQLSDELKNLRNAEFHAVLETFQRPESVLFYKRIVEINKVPQTEDLRRCGLNIIFRFNILDFLQKASDPYETHLTIDPVTRKLLSVRLPKVYHLNLIFRSTFLNPDKTKTVELKKLRIVIDKNGIKRIEHVSKG